MDLKLKPTITLGGEQHFLSFELYDYSEAENRLGEVLIIDGGQISLGTTPYLATLRALFVGMCRTNPALTFEQVEALINWDNLAELQLAIQPVFAEIGERNKRISDRILAYQEAAARNGTMPTEEPSGAPLAGAPAGASDGRTPVSISDFPAPNSGRSTPASGATTSKSNAKSISAKSA